MCCCRACNVGHRRDVHELPNFEPREEPEADLHELPSFEFLRLPPQFGLMLSVGGAVLRGSW
jgi:hypothetical protein